MKIVMTLAKVSEDGNTVIYGGEQAKRNPLLAGDVVLRKASLPVPPPTVLSVTLEWEPAPQQPESAGDERSPAATATQPHWPAEVKPGDLLIVIKSRSAGVKSPPEWLAQYVGKSGRVLWTTADGAMLDIEGKASWFAFAELKPA